MDIAVGVDVTSYCKSLFKHSTDSKKQYCDLFNTILLAHSELHQIPKFFVKLLLALTECIKEDSGGKFIANGQILPEVQESIERCVQKLPPKQMIELWKIFIETFSSLEIMSEAFMTSKSFVFFVAQLFTTFLLHAQLFQANMPSNTKSQFSGLIECTSEEIKKNISALKNIHPQATPLQRSVLLLSFALGKVKLSYNAHYDNPIDSFDNQLSVDTFDFSIVHNYLNKEYAAILESYLCGDDKILSALVFQLLLQKMEAIQLVKSLSKEDIMQMPISIVIQHLQKNSSAIAPWDKDLCMISDKNYGTVLWMMFLKVFPLVLPYCSHKDLYILCDSIQSIVLQDDCSDTGTKCIIVQSIESELIHESKYFQTVFVSALWNQKNLLVHKKRSYDDIEDQSTAEKMFSLLNTYHSEDLKYAQRTPKSNRNLGSVCDEIKEVSELLNSVLLSESLSKDKMISSKTLDVIKLLNSLPLEYLLPGTQMKCVIGLSFLFFLVPQSCKSAEAVILAKEISSAMVSIFKGVRSIWLFNFVNSGLYLKFVMKTLQEVINESDDECDWAIQLIDHLISLMLKNVDSLDTIEQCISKLEDTSKSRTTLITFCSLLRKLSQVLRPHKEEKYKVILQKISSVVCSCFTRYMVKNFNENSKSIDSVLFIKGYTEVVEIACGSSYVIHEAVQKECLKPLSSTVEMAVDAITSSEINSMIYAYLLFISKVCKHKSKLSSSIPEKFVSVSWKLVLSHFKKKMSKSKSSDSTKENIMTPLTASKVKTCSICSKQSFLDKNEEKKDLFIGTLAPVTVNECEEESLRELCMITSIKELSEVFQGILLKLNCSFSFIIDVKTFQVFLLVFRYIIDNIGDKSRQPVLNQSIQKCLSFLHTVMNQACCSQVCQTMISIPILDFMSFILKGNKGLPRQLLFQSLHCIVVIPVDVVYNNYELYAKLFTAAWNVVYNLFMHHTSLILASPAPFLAYVSKLLKSIVRAGAVENLSKCGIDTFHQVQLCAQNINRLLTVISRNKTEFKNLVPYLVAEYVETVQHITLESNIKDSIVSGINRVLDLCSQDSIRMLAITISYSSREIFSNLIKNYKKNKYAFAT